MEIYATWRNFRRVCTHKKTAQLRQKRAGEEDGVNVQTSWESNTA